MGCHFLLQRIFLTQGLNLGLPQCRQTLYRLSYQGSPINFLDYLPFNINREKNLNIQFDLLLSSYQVSDTSLGSQSLIIEVFFILKEGERKRERELSSYHVCMKDAELD